MAFFTSAQDFLVSNSQSRAKALSAKRNKTGYGGENAVHLNHI